MAGDHQAMRKDGMSQKDHRAIHIRRAKSKADSSLWSGEVGKAGAIDLEVCSGDRMIDPSSHFLHGIEKGDQNPKDRVIILLNQITSAAYCLVKASKFPDEADGLIAHAKSELIDAYPQLDMLCLDLGWNPDEIKRMGLQHTWERFRDFEAKGWR